MTTPCPYHWHWEKKDGKIVCCECGTSIQEAGKHKDIGADHFISPVMHASSCGKDGPGGFLVMHFKQDGSMCEGLVGTCQTCHPKVSWEMDGEGESTTLKPSILCGCGDHGFIRAGKWVVAK